MLVALLEDVKALGLQGQVVEVPEGYAVNFLFPQHLAVAERANAGLLTPPSPRPPNKAEREEEKLAADIDGLEVVVSMKSVKGKLKTPVTNKDIKKALKDMGHAVDAKFIATPPLNDFNTFDVPVEFPSGFESELRVTIEPS